MNDTKRSQLNEQRLSGVIEPLKEKVVKLISILEAQNYKPLITCGFRSIAEQNRLYSLGRSRAGKIVTNAKGGQSNHNFGKAVDFAFIDDKGAISWDMKYYRKLGEVARSVGLKWGGEWKRFKDYPHVEL